MGNWGFSILAGDLARDVAGDVQELIDARKASPTAIGRLRDRYLSENLGDEDDEAEVLLAIAAALYEAGKVDDDAYARALAVIMDRRGLTRWREQGPESEAARVAAYEEMADALRAGPVPRLRTKRLRAPRLGDVLRIPLPDGRFAYGHCWPESTLYGLAVQILGTSRIEFATTPTVPLEPPGFGPLFCTVSAGVKRCGWRTIGYRPPPGGVWTFIAPVAPWGSGQWRAVVNDETVYRGSDLPMQYRACEFYMIFTPEFIVERVMRGGQADKWYRYPGAPVE